MTDPQSSVAHDVSTVRLVVIGCVIALLIALGFWQVGKGLFVSLTLTLAVTQALATLGSP